MSKHHHSNNDPLAYQALPYAAGGYPAVAGYPPVVGYPGAGGLGGYPGVSGFSGGYASVAYRGGGYGGYAGWGIRWIYALLILIVIVLQFGRRDKCCANVPANPCDDGAVIGTGCKCDNQLIDNSVLFIIVVFLLILCSGCWLGGGRGFGGYGGYGGGGFY